MTRSVLLGRAGSPGVGLGRLLLVAPEPNGHAPYAGAAGPIGAAIDAASERTRLLAALDTAATDLEALARQVAMRAGDEVGAIFEAQALFARDPGIIGPALDAIAAGTSADIAILASTDEQAGTLAAVDDEYFRARAADVRDVGRRVADLLRGSRRSDLWHTDGAPAIIVAEDLDPSAVATLRPELVAGIALGGGAPTGHAAIVARGLGIPLVLGLGGAAAHLAASLPGLVDGGLGRLIVEPDDADIVSATLTDTPGTTPSTDSGDVRITVSANVGSVLEAIAASRAGAAGIGLVRTELLFLGRQSPPSVAEQRATYARIRDAFPDQPVVFRTLDVGGDKPAAWQEGRSEANPALGLRGVRLGLARPAVLDDQLTALLEAATGGEIRIMLPMVATVDEVVAVRRRLDSLVETMVAQGVVPPAVQLGVMIEVPSAALIADGLAEVADFFSIGTNDLVQYTLAADRTNPAVADLATALQPAVLRLIDLVVRAATSRGLHVAVCGESAADPEMIARGVVPPVVRLGVMIEVPSAALIADGLAGVADFFSIGTNDLVQYTLAADRTNPAVADLATALQPAVLRLIDLVVRAARPRGLHVAVCGESAADPEMVALLIGLGVDELSVAPGSVAAVLARTRTLDVAACRDLAAEALDAVTVAEVRALVRGET